MAAVVARSTAEVLRDHLDKRCRGEFDQDLRANYSPRVAMLVADGVYRGHDGVRALKRRLDRALPNPTFRYTARVVDGDVALLLWSATSDGGCVDDGADSFVIRDGAIVVQTIHYTVRPRRS